ncbi:MAG: hypothetical protein DDT33_01505 [Firmicutes bacterium]|nr:hypothetical protein [Bacillota bacterium]
MPNPQLENGYTKLANELIEAFCRINLSSYESRILWCIIRKTYGWKKKVDRLSNSQIVQATGISKGHVSRALKSLRAKNIVTCSGNKQIGIQKDYSLWQIQKLPIQVTNGKLPIQVTELPNQVTKVTYSGNKKLPVQEPQKKRKKLTKETIQKKEYGEFSNVLLTDEEYSKLQDKFGDQVNCKIEILSEGIASKGYKYKNHYAAILAWDRRDERRKEAEHAKTRTHPRPGAPGYKYEDPD